MSHSSFTVKFWKIGLSSFSFILLLTYPFYFAFGKNISINETFEQLVLGKHLEIFEDTTQQLTIHNIIENPTVNFNKNTYDNIIPGARRSSNIWAKFELYNESENEKFLVLRLGDFFIKYIDCFIVENSKLSTSYKGGLQSSFFDRPIAYKNSAFPISIPPAQRLTIYIKVDWSYDTAQVPIELYSAAAFQEKAFWEYLSIGIILGLLITSVFIGLLLYLATQRRLYFFYFIFTFCNVFLIAGYAGVDYQYFLSNFPTISHNTKLVVGIISIFSIYMIIVDYFRGEGEEISIKQWHFRPMIFLFGVGLLMGIFQDHLKEYVNLFIPPGLFVTLMVLINFYLLLKILFKKIRWNNLIFFIGFMGWLVHGVTFMLVNHGKIILPINDFQFASICIFLDLTCLSILLFHRIYRLREEKFHLDSEIEIARMEQEKAIKVKELDVAKTRLYTNITHEFRTPLTVIQGLTAQIKGNQPYKNIIQRNSDTLLRLINQLLEVSKAEKGAIKLQLVQTDLISYLAYVVEPFQNLANQKGLCLQFTPKVKACEMDFDPIKIQEVITNLISNALKNTLAADDIYVFVHKIENQLAITVKDTGKGIAAKDLPHIFDRFYQATQRDMGSDIGNGIGLSLCQELVQLMNGTITVKSELGIGSTFSIILPITNTAKLVPKKDWEHSTNLSLQFSPIVPITKNTINKADSLNRDKDLPSILIVEDNADVRNYISICLNSSYQLTLAENGKIGIEKAFETTPDLILSDVMMPEMNGIDFCHTLKKDTRTSHIPIILLTAKATINDKIEGFQAGADDYIFKPFHQEELLLRIQNRLEQQRRMREMLTHGLTKLTSKVFPIEHAFLVKCKEIIHTNFSNAQFGVVELAQAHNMSQSTLLRKIKSLTGRTISNYLSVTRLEAGQSMLENSAQTIAQIAIEIGFNDASHFSTRFKKEYGFPPSDLRK